MTSAPTKRGFLNGLQAVIATPASTVPKVIRERMQADLPGAGLHFSPDWSAAVLKTSRSTLATHCGRSSRKVALRRKVDHSIKCWEMRASTDIQAVR